MTAREYLGCVLMFAAVILAQIPHAPEKGGQSRKTQPLTNLPLLSRRRFFFPPVLPIHRNSSGPSHFFHKNVVPSSLLTSGQGPIK